MITNKKWTSIMVSILILFVVGITISCSNPITSNHKFSDTSDIDYQISSVSELRQELWIVDGKTAKVKTIEELRALLETNENLFTLEGKLNVKMLSKFMDENVGNYRIVTEEDDDYYEILSTIAICCLVRLPNGEEVIIIIIMQT